MRTLLLNPPSFECFDGGAGSRYPARRETHSFWYPVWLAYPAGMIPESRLLDAPSHGITPEETVRIASGYDFVVVFSSTAGFHNDVALAERMKEARPGLKIGFVGPHVTALPEDSLRASPAIDFVVRREFEDAVTEFAAGKPMADIAGLSLRKDGRIVHTPDRPLIQDLDRLPFVVEVYKRDLDIRKYNIPFFHYPYLSFYTSRGCPALCTFCLWPQTMGSHEWRTRTSDNVVAEVRRARELFPEVKEIVFDDDTFTVGKARVLELCRKLGPLNITWSCNARAAADLETLRAMRQAGCRLLIVGFESGEPAVLKNIKKGITVEQGLAFMKSARRLGFKVHGDFQIGLPGETRQTIEQSLRYAMKLDPDTIQVSMAHPYPGTELHRYLEEHGCFVPAEMTDELGHQLPNFEYPGLSRSDIVKAVEDFYGRYYYRPRIILRIVGRGLLSAADRRRLSREAREFLALRRKRRAFVRAARSGG